MKTIYLLKGLPASGKSTWAKSHVDATTKRVNKDDLRAMLDNGRWSRDNEKFVLQLRDHIVVEALAAGKHVIVDDTNLHPKHEARMRQLARENNARVEVVEFDTSLEECIRRDLERPSSVGEKVIRKMHAQFLAEPWRPREQDPALPAAVIVDIDGTLALMGDRDPYDASTCEQDSVNEPVREAVVDLSDAGTVVILVSGRSAKFRAQTERWISGHNIPCDGLFMRAEGDMRKDAIIKREIYEQHIEGRYYVRFVLDDRNQTVEGWRELGLPCFQVAPGDF